MKRKRTRPKVATPEDEVREVLRGLGPQIKDILKQRASDEHERRHRKDLFPSLEEPLVIYDLPKKR